MSEVPFDRLPREFPRNFVPLGANLGRWEEIEPLFHALSARAVRGTQDLALWLLDRSELAACLDEEETRRSVRMTMKTDDPECEAAFTTFITDIIPRCRPRWHKLRIEYLEHPGRARLPRERFLVLDRHVENEVRLFREANIPLETEESLLAQAYQKVIGAMTVNFRGEERTLPQMARFQEETDRAQRRAAWAATAQRRLDDRDALEDIFDRMIDVRDAMARNAGFENYRDYTFSARGRFDYGVEDCLRFHRSVEKVAVPLAKDILERRRLAMGLATVHPWDTSVDPKGRPPLRPFEESAGLVNAVTRVVQKVDGDLAEQLRWISDLGLLDLQSRKAKAPGGYQATLSENRLPFIFMNAAGRDEDLRTLLHESGHAFHTIAARAEPLISYRSAPIEFCEVASMAMELMGAEHLGEVYGDGDRRRALRERLEHIVLFFPWMAQVDAFQHWVYTHPGQTRDERRRAWDELTDRFWTGVDWTGVEIARSYQWHRQLHIFEYPFYYVEYGIAQLGALQVWQNYRRDARTAVSQYRGALGLGGTRALPELFQAAGARFDFGEATLAGLMNEVVAELKRLEDA